MLRVMTVALVAGLTLLNGCGKRFEVTDEQCAVVPKDARYELSEQSREEVDESLHRTVELRMLERQAREGEGPGTVVPKGTPISVSEKQDPAVPDWTHVKIEGGEAAGRSGLVRRSCLGAAGG